MAQNPGIRREPREELVRIVECRRPAAGREPAAPIFGFTRNVSGSGLCLALDEPEPVGSELRIALRDLTGVGRGPARARVVWCRGGRDGRFWLGLKLLDTGPAARPPKPSRARSAGASAGA